MKELSGIIEIYPISELPSNFSNSELESEKYKKYVFHANELAIEPILEESSGGVIYNCDQDIVGDIINDQAIHQLKIRTSCIIKLQDTAGKNIILGTYYIPATVLLIPYLQRYKLSIKCNMLISPY